MLQKDKVSDSDLQTIVQEQEQYYQSFTEVCQKSILLSGKMTSQTRQESFNQQMEQVKLQWSDLCFHITQRKRAKELQALKKEENTILSSKEPLETQLSQINQLVERIDSIGFEDNEAEPLKKEIIARKMDLEKASMLKDKMKKRYTEEVKNVIISVEEYVVDIDDPDFEHVIEVLYSNQTKLDSVRSTMEDLSKEDENLKEWLPIEDYQEYVECVTEIQEIFYEKETRHSNMALIVQVVFIILIFPRLSY